MNGALTPTQPTSAAAASQLDPSGDSDELARERAIKQIERRRRFNIDIFASAVVMALVAAIWAVGEYYNAGGWPTNGFSQSSGIHDTWNIWIIYPFMAWVVFLALRTWSYYGHKPITESEIQHELERQARGR